MKKSPDITGLKFSRLNVIKRASHPSKLGIYYLCKCDCGKEKIIFGNSIYRGMTKSCGCYAKENAKNINYKHGEWSAKNSPEYVAWQNIKGRCGNKNRDCYSDYGGKGVIVCERWFNSFELFLLDMGRRPSDKHTIDRFPNAKGNYEPDNCRWATREEQSRNYVNKNVWIEHDGVRLVQKDWAKKLNVSDYFISSNLKRNIPFLQIIELAKIKNELNGSFK